MPRILAVILVAAAAIGLGATAAWLGRQDERRIADQDRVPVPTLSQRLPAFHVDLDSPERVGVTRTTLRRLTSSKARTLGDHKDDIALLADDPAVVREILESFSRRAALSRYEAAAFVDIFERVAHSDFVAPLRRLMNHEDPTVRSKTIPAALTQAHPSLTPELDRLYLEMLRDHPGEGAYTRARILHAASACGGEHLPALLVRGLEDEDPEVRGGAVRIVGEKGGLGLEPRVRDALSDSHPAVRYYAGWALLRLGRAMGEQAIRDAIASPDERVAAMALEDVARLGWKNAVPAVRAVLIQEGVSREVQFAATLALARLGDGETISRLAGEARRSDLDPQRQQLAVAGLAATGDPVHLPMLREMAAIGQPRLTAAIDAGLSMAPEGPVDLELAARMIDTPRIHVGNIHAVLRRGGDALVSLLQERLQEAEDSKQIALLTACLGETGSAQAREVLVLSRPLHPRIIGEQIRRLDLQLRRGRRLP